MIGDLLATAPTSFRLEVWGDWACFTRPELKVERVSYDETCAFHIQ